MLVVGDLNPDLVVGGDVVPRFGQAEQLLEHAIWTVGGSAAITAHGFARLGRPVSLVAAVGKDVFGARVVAELAAASVEVDHVLERADQPTGLTIVLCHGDDRAMLTLPGAIATLAAGEVLDTVAATTDLQHVHVASMFLVPMAGNLAQVLGAARQRGLTVSLDTNDDPSGAWRGVHEVLPLVDVLLPNRSEALALGGGDDVETAARRLAEQGPLVVVKDGAAGALAVTRDGAVARVAAPLAPAVVDTTGAGDTFDAAFLDSWLAGLPLTTCLARAAHAGARAVSAVGGTTAQPTRADLDRIGDPQ